MNTVDLLWRHELPSAPRRGRPPKLTHDQVVTAAVAVADRIGAAFTLRHVAEALGVPVMSLYSYVDGREQLLELMVDDCRATMAVSAVPGDVLGDGDGDWRARLTAVAADNLALFADHPWLADIESERAVLGPGTLAKYERELTAVESLAVGDVEKDAALSLVLDFTRSAARALSHAARERDGETPGDWWDREGAELGRLGVTDRFPLASRIGTAAGRAHGAAHDARHAYHFGLQVILDGLGCTESR
ncbi:MULTISPECIES: TetR/AcrR family transcriptional regulator C-terminal domain-containing protein [Mycobacteriaceae]|uniref:TetR/AcrR family transcriptional regulator C-terminal domain-containing protein n=1 Tax=Mycolicibacterium parafortuitum TaxID=39692 RepID=A0ACC6MGS6_MYCPF|nr:MULTISPECIES: TetR/AcrR family transcriptional regulator C-terminal domain-containing protein [Mycobacteriaceae]MDZ5086155.1 TetR/AcrR family transcriptional regulator C-terminal domain-containing protein [Mycolicibacterium parafortuitum]GFM19295.1 TetR family transcriptional regulator [Mycobacterium sp. PO1]GFM25461.1 TetR family transcriptional regulator [Mycobacterium sp. PO2]